MYFLYILRGLKNHIYVGVTNNIDNRIFRHQSGDGAEFTKRNQALLEARGRETQVKGWRREKKENLIKFGRPIL